MNMQCPKCGAADPMYSKKRGVYVCEECGHEFAPEKPFELLRIFISYGHDEHMALAVRLRDDLRERGHEAWFDEERLLPGHDWEENIEKGLSWAAEGKPLAAVVLLLTPHSVRRPDGFCLNEVARALALGLRIVPLMVVESEPPLSICRIQWLDMRECIPIHEKEALYASRYERLLAALEEENLDFEGAQSRLLKALQPIRFSADILKMLQGFTGREWLFDEIDKWFKDPRGSKIFWLTGAPGVGKSAVAAWIREHRREIAAFHFCDICSEEKRDPAKLVRSVAYQLSTQLPEYRDRLSRLDLDEIVGEYREAYTLFDKLVVQPLAEEFPDPGRTLVVLVDALDEATHDRRNEIARFLARGAGKTPPWLRFFVTSRPEPEIVSALQSHSPRVLDASGEENLADLRRYLVSALPGITPGQTEEILRRSEGVFLYVRHVVEAVRNGSLSLDRIDLFPRGLGDVYLQFFERQFGADLKEYEEKITPVLQPVFAAVEPLRLDFLRSVCRIEEATELERTLNRLGSLFPVSGEGEEATIRPFHRSLVDWISDRRSAGHFVIAPSDGHRVLAEHCLQEYRKGVEQLSPYALRHLPAHLIAAGRWDDLIGDDAAPGVLTNLRYIQAKCEAGQVYDLTKDYNTALDALPEFREEKEYLARRDDAMRRYNAALREYAGKRYDWLKSKEAGSPTQEPPYPELPDILKDENRPPIPETSSARAARLRHFANFLAARAEAIRGYPEQTMQIACNFADDRSPVSVQGRKLLEDHGTPFLLRSPRPPAPPFRPQCFRVIEGHIGNEASVSPDGRRALSVSGDKLRLWDLESGECLRMLDGQTVRITSVSVSPDGRQAVSGSLDNTLRLWDLESGECLRVLEGHKGRVTSVSMSPEGTRAVSGSADTTLRLWDLESGECLRVMEGHEQWVTSVSVSPDWRRAVSGSADKTLRLWDLESGECLRVMEGHKSCVDSVSVSPDWRRAVSGSADKTLRLWDLEIGECLRVMWGHEKDVTSVSMSADGRRAVSGSEDKKLCLWDLESGERLRVLRGHSREVTSVSMSASGRRAVSGSDDNTLRLWDLESGDCLRVLEGHEDRVWTVCVSADWRRAISGSRDGMLCLWDLESGECLRMLDGQTVRITSVSVSADWRRAVSGCGYGTLRLWDLESGVCLRVLKGHESQVWSMSISPDGRRAVSGSVDETLRLWDLESGECLRVLEGHSDWVYSVRMSPDGRRAVSGSYDGTLRLWDLESGECLRVLEGHSNWVYSVSVSADWRRAISGSRDGTLRLWDLETGKCLAMYCSSSVVTTANLSPEGDRFVCGTEDGQIHLLSTVGVR